MQLEVITGCYFEVLLPYIYYITHTPKKQENKV